MKVLSTFVTIILLLLAVVLLLPVISIGLSLIGVLVVVAIWVTPMWIIATSEKTTGMEKIAWLLAMICLSWFAWVFYFLIAPIKPKRPEYDYY